MGSNFSTSSVHNNFRDNCLEIFFFKLKLHFKVTIFSVPEARLDLTAVVAATLILGGEGQVPQVI